SDDESVATVDSEGLVAGHAPGTTTIKATSEGKSAQAEVTVSIVPVETVEVSPETASLIVGETQEFVAIAKSADGDEITGRTVSWETSDPDVATIDGDGVVTAVSPGEATITAEIDGKVSAGATVTVSLVPVATVEVSPTTAGLTVGATQTLSAIARSTDGAILDDRAVTWSTENASVATVDENGLVRGVGVGQVTISAEIDGKVGTASVTVSTAPVASITLNPSTTEVVAGQDVVIIPTLRSATNTVIARATRLVFWISSDESIATVENVGDGRGRVHGVTAGVVTITATSEGQSATAQVR